jgi:hypothetical protein
VSDTRGPEPADRSWHIVSRWQEFEGEARANLLRIAGIGCFYFVALLDYYGLHVGLAVLAIDGMVIAFVGMFPFCNTGRGR